MNEPFVLLSVDPGPGSFWPPERFAELAETLAGEDRVPVLVGFAPVSEAVAAVRQACPAAVDLTGNTSVGDLVFLTWAATAAFGLDNGAMHLAAAAGCPSVVLYDLASDPALVGQRGDAVTILRRPQLADVPLGEVVAALRRGRRERVGARRTPVA